MVNGILIRPIVDFKEQITLFDALIVGHIQLQNGSIDDGSNSDVVGKNLGIIGLRMPSCD